MYKKQQNNQTTQQLAPPPLPLPQRERSEMYYMLVDCLQEKSQLPNRITCLHINLSICKLVY